MFNIKWALCTAVSRHFVQLYQDTLYSRIKTLCTAVSRHFVQPYQGTLYSCIKALCTAASRHFVQPYRRFIVKVVSNFLTGCGMPELLRSRHAVPLVYLILYSRSWSLNQSPPPHEKVWPPHPKAVGFRGSYEIKLHL